MATKRGMTVIQLSNLMAALLRSMKQTKKETYEEVINRTIREGEECKKKLNEIQVKLEERDE